MSAHPDVEQFDTVLDAYQKANSLTARISYHLARIPDTVQIIAQSLSPDGDVDTDLFSRPTPQEAFERQHCVTPAQIPLLERGLVLRERRQGLELLATDSSLPPHILNAFLITLDALEEKYVDQAAQYARLGR